MEWSVKDLEYCTYCPKLCQHACPVSSTLGRETLIPQAKMQIMNLLRRRVLPWHPDLTEPLFACTGCRRCTQVCLHGNEVDRVLEKGRAWSLEQGAMHPALADLPARFRARNERLVAKLRREIPGRRFAGEAQVGYFPGCDTIDDALDDVRDALTLFDSLGLSFVRLVTTPLACAGYPLWAAGHHEAARAVARELVQHLRQFSTLIVGCPACTLLLRERLPAEGFEHRTEILHITEYLYIHAERLPIQRVKASAYYHDPCFLGRHLGVHDPPRRLLARCVQSPREFFHSRSGTECCGGGGLLPHTFPEATALQARRRLEEVERAEVPLLVSACATCERTLRRAGSRVEIVDILNLLAWALGPMPPAG